MFEGNWLNIFVAEKNDTHFNNGEFQWQKRKLIFAPSIKIMQQWISFSYPNYLIQT
jgi:hypothetical protein